MSVFKSNKQQDFEKLVRPHLHAMYRLAFRLTGSRDRSEDLVQETVAKIYPRQHELAKLDNPGSWLAKVLYHLFIDLRRREQRSPVVNITDLGEDSAQIINLDIFPGQQSSVENAIEQGQFIQRLDSALGQLNEDQRMALMMYEVEGYSLGEIEEITDVPVGTLKSRLHRARIQLKSLFIEGTDHAEDSCKEIGDT